MLVRRTLPHRDIRMIGAFCFVDHYGGPGAGSSLTRPMVVPPHPHMGLQTVSWLLEGAIDHHDSAGSLQRVRPSELNLMTAGAGIAHSEYSHSEGRQLEPLHGVQLWVALPESARHQEPHFEHHGNLPVVGRAGITCTVILGTFMEATSEASTYSSLTCVEISASSGRHVLQLMPDHEHGLLPLESEVVVEGRPVPRGALHYVGPGSAQLTIEVRQATRLLLIGGTPFIEHLLMWWNFVGRDHDEIVSAREAWASGTRFGTVVEDANDPLPAPEIPQVRLQPRPPRRS
jgi:redox-sensitive bicupin YhaK (pirin superfamily)